MKKISVGLLFSTDGSYRYMGRSALEGALFAIEQINNSKSYPFKLIAESENAKGIDESYISSIRNLLEKGITHFFGPITSSARKILLPEIQKNKAMLWFSSPYEGYECEEQVVYLGPCPNQNLMPLMNYALPKYGKKVALVSSNYVWGWESSRIAKEMVKANSGYVVFDALFHMQELDFTLCINNILKEKLSFIINNLVGESNYSFLKQLNSALKGSSMIVLSCNLTECELGVLGDLPNLELISSNPFFESRISPKLSTKQLSFNRTRRSGYFWAAYLSVFAFAKAIKLSQSLAIEKIQSILPDIEMLSPKGQLIKLNKNQHMSLPCTIALRVNGYFESILETEIIEPNPFMSFQNFTVTPKVIELSSYSKRLKAI
jgi:ABC-type branched-subunit amino acid transport system substrate-binding protein